MVHSMGVAYPPMYLYAFVSQYFGKGSTPTAVAYYAYIAKYMVTQYRIAFVE